MYKKRTETFISRSTAIERNRPMVKNRPFLEFATLAIIFVLVSLSSLLASFLTLFE